VPRRTAVDLRRLAHQAAEDATVTAPGRHVAVHADHPCTVLGDPDQLRRMLGNLIRNAVVHTPPATPIELDLAATEAVVRLQVRDHGPGLPAGAEDQLFERFWRAEGGRHRGPGGAGLGLAIVRAIAHAHGGEVSADNAPGGGARFVVTLPAAAEPAVSQETLSVLTGHSYLGPTH